MNDDLISKKTRQVFREYLVGWILREISDEFDAYDVPCDLEYQPPVSGQRRSLVEQYYHAVDWKDKNDVRKVLQAYEGILRKAQEEAENNKIFYPDNEAYQRPFKLMIQALKRDGYVWTGERIVAGAGMPSLDEIKETAVQFDAKHLTEQIHRIEQAVDADPALAIGTAKELVETCCRTILSERGKLVIGSPDISTLTKQTLKELNLVPDGIPEKAKGSEIMKRLLSNLATIGHGLAEIRNLYGTGHGKEGSTQAIRPRHAKLAVGAATTLARFLFETHKETLA